MRKKFRVVSAKRTRRMPRNRFRETFLTTRQNHCCYHRRVRQAFGDQRYIYVFFFPFSFRPNQPIKFANGIEERSRVKKKKNTTRQY